MKVTFVKYKKQGRPPIRDEQHEHEPEVHEHDEHEHEHDHEHKARVI